MIKSFKPINESCEQFKAVTTLRSDKQIDKTISPKVSPKAILAKEKETMGNFEGGDAHEKEKIVNLNVHECPISAPFSQRLKPSAKLANYLDIIEMFKQVKINISLLDVIKQIP